MSQEETTNGVNGVSEEQALLMAEEEAEKAKMRPIDIDQDMKVRDKVNTEGGLLISVLLQEMERRKRVDKIMNSDMFREELERIIESQIGEGFTGYQVRVWRSQKVFNQILFLSSFRLFKISLK